MEELNQTVAIFDNDPNGLKHLNLICMKRHSSGEQAAKPARLRPEYQVMLESYVNTMETISSILLTDQIYHFLDCANESLSLKELAYLRLPNTF